MQTADQRREHFEVERELRQRLMSAPTKEERRRLYGVVYGERTARLTHHPLVAQAADPAARAAAVAPQARLLRRFVRPGDTFLEVGAHDGAIAKAVAPLVAQAIAVDVHDGVALASADNFEFRVFDGFSLGLADDSVDVVYSNDVVEHLHPDDFFDQAQEVRRVLRPGGRYVCVTPNGLTGPHDVSRDFTDTPEGFHLVEYTTAELVAAFQRAGYRRVQILLTYRGHRLSPIMSPVIVRPLEVIIARLPHRLRQRLVPVLAAIKVIATV